MIREHHSVLKSPTRLPRKLVLRRRYRSGEKLGGGNGSDRSALAAPARYVDTRSRISTRVPPSIQSADKQRRVMRA